MLPVIRFKGGEVCSDNGVLEKGDVWVRGGKIIEPMQVFYEERKAPDVTVDCRGLIVAPGFIDIQINGAFGVDFSSLAGENLGSSLDQVSHGLLQHGVTAYCPTLVTSSRDYYHRVIPLMGPKKGGLRGAAVLGVHCEGPFINPQKKGAHQESYILQHLSPAAVRDCYGDSLKNVKIVTLAPELSGSDETIQWLTQELGSVVSLGHSMSSLDTAEHAFGCGASLITHLFNAMLPFHHRDPGLVGLLTDLRLDHNQVHYSIIADGIHTHETVLRIAYQSNPTGIVLVTDAIAAMGLGSGRHQLGTMTVEVKGNTARLPGEQTLAGSCATMVDCVREMVRATGCEKGAALLAASHHPAKVLGMEGKKGTVCQIGADADLVLLDQDLGVQATCIAGEVVWRKRVLT